MGMDKITITIGYDADESVAYHTFCQSIIEKSTIPVQIIPLSKKNWRFYTETKLDGSNDFIYTRFLTPYLCEYKGWAIYADSDMICRDDIKKLWQLKDEKKAVQVVKHEYKTKRKIKYLGNKNEDYPRKNWSSLILWNCEHKSNKKLTTEYVKNSTGKELHRFNWLADEEIGDLPIEWNWLDIEYDDNEMSKLIHFTLGTPCFKEYSNTKMAKEWFDMHKKSIKGFD